MMTFIDYTSFYYTSIAGTPAPAVITGKFVQIRHENILYLVFSPKEFTKYHANIIERFCMDKSIEGSYDAKREKFTIRDQAWQVLGGGKFERDGNKKAIKLYDNSMAYGKFNAWIRNCSTLSEFAGYTSSSSSCSLTLTPDSCPLTPYGFFSCLALLLFA
jgi:hypothetical protein